MSKPKRMLASTVQKRLAKAEENYLDAIQEVADELRERMVIPFCKKHNLKFLAGMGTFLFSKEDGSHLSADIDPPCLRKQEGYVEGARVPGTEGLAKALWEIPPLHVHAIGSYMGDYTPPGFKE